MQTVRIHWVKRGDLTNDLIQNPGVGGYRFGNLTQCVEPARCQFKKALLVFGMNAGVVIDIAAQFPRQDIQAKISEKSETIEDWVPIEGCFMNGAIAHVAQFNF